MNHHRLGLVLAGALLASAGGACAEDRLPVIPPAQYTPAQRQAADEFQAVRKAPLSGPFLMFMQSPEMMTRARAMGDYLRYRSAIGNTLSEFAILITARDWGQDYEWSVHAPIAAKAGIKTDVIEALRQGRRPDGMNPDETIVYEFSTELLRNKSVSDPTFASAEARFGKPGVVDLVGLLGYYTLDAMVLNVGRYPPQDGPAVQMPHFPQ
jgi:4-carboxymuconolactone decarboxylase